MTKLPLQLHIFILIISIVFISVSVKTIIENKYFEDYIIKSGAEKVLFIAELTAVDKLIVEAFNDSDPAKRIQPHAEEIRLKSKTSFVVIINMESVRYSHPNIGNIGKTFVGGDEVEALKGATYVSQAKGTLGISLRAFAPVYNDKNIQIGVVSVGLLLNELGEKNLFIKKILIITAIISIIIGLIGGILLANNIRKTIFGLEPYQIASLLEERDAIISSINEGIVAVDRDLNIILINKNAKKLIGISEIPINGLISDYFPDSRLPHVIETGEKILNLKQHINGRHLHINLIPLIHNDKVIGAVSSFIDVSDILNLTAELDEIKSYSDALRSQHHEHLNKLNVMSGLIQMGKYEEATEYIVSTVSNQQYISDLLRERVLTPTICGLLIAKINRANEQHIELTIHPQSTFPAIKKGPSVSLVLIIGNIIENSIESLSKSQKSNKNITIFLTQTIEEIEIRISDNGMGISPDLKEKIFEYGYSSKETSVRGIGLYLVREHIELLHGELELNIENTVEFIIKISKKYLL